MAEPAIEGDRKESRRRWHCWWIALLAVALVACATLWSGQWYRWCGWLSAHEC